MWGILRGVIKITWFCAIVCIRHKKLSEIFQKPAVDGSNLHDHFYRLTCGGDFHILFLYVSPVENIKESLIQHLQNDLCGNCTQYANITKKSYFCGTISQASDFYN